MEINEEMRDDINLAILAGVREALNEAKQANGAKLTPAKKDEMRNTLKLHLLNDFKQLFVQANVSREQATNFISYLVDMELRRI